MEAPPTFPDPQNSLEFLRRRGGEEKTAEVVCFLIVAPCCAKACSLDAKPR